jgi:hypothetical protein
MTDDDLGDLLLTLFFWIMGLLGFVMTLREVCHLIS